MNEYDAAYLIAAAYLHDIGYAPGLQKTGFHPLDGAYYVRSFGDERLASLIAHHSEARFEAGLRGYAQEIEAFPRERSATMDALVYCDLTTGPTGRCVSLKERSCDLVLPLSMLRCAKSPARAPDNAGSRPFLLHCLTDKQRCA